MSTRLVLLVNILSYTDKKKIHLIIHYGGKCNKELVTEVPEKFSQSFELSSFIILSQNVLLKSPFFSRKKTIETATKNTQPLTSTVNSTALFLLVSTFDRLQTFKCINGDARAEKP